VKIQKKDKAVGQLIKATTDNDDQKVVRFAKKLLEEYYGKSA